MILYSPNGPECNKFNETGVSVETLLPLLTCTRPWTSKSTCAELDMVREPVIVCVPRNTFEPVVAKELVLNVVPDTPVNPLPSPTKDPVNEPVYVPLKLPSISTDELWNGIILSTLIVLIFFIFF